jgi:GTP diphosphokinase / guanosine-3',5'-bis(diphosphate) 3'-diphosphatase
VNTALEAMQFARLAHSGHFRKYTGNPYSDHLAEVAGIAATASFPELSSHSTAIAVCWLHDCVEDQRAEIDDLARLFGPTIAQGVLTLSDLETGNRKERVRASIDRLSAAPAWIQTIKVADLISNTSSIVTHDPKFAKVYLPEKQAMLAALTKVDRSLVAIAQAQIADALREAKQ